MAQRRHHYDSAFEDYLRRRRVPYVSVDEARRALLPAPPTPADAAPRPHAVPAPASLAIKSFDFVVYDAGINRLVEVKGRKLAAPRARAATTPGRFQTWVTRADIEALTHWESLFGPGFQACIVFLFWCDAQPPDGLFQEIFIHRQRWYVMRAVALDDYTKHMKTRSQRWDTVDLPTSVFRNISRPFSPTRPAQRPEPVTPARVQPLYTPTQPPYRLP